MLLSQPQLSTQTMNAMKVENVVPLPLEFNEYAEATLDILGEEARMTPPKLLKYKTVVYTVLKAFVVPLRSIRFIIFFLLKSNELILLYRARGDTCPILSYDSHSYIMLVLCRFQCITIAHHSLPFNYGRTLHRVVASFCTVTDCIILVLCNTVALFVL